jgi:hypothetical protein
MHIANISIEHVVVFKYLVTAVANRNTVMKKLSADRIRVMLATIRFKSFTARLLFKSLNICMLMYEDI